MHLALLNHVYDPQYADADALLDRYTSLTGWAEAVQQQGWRVSVVQRFTRNVQIERNGVMYDFVRDMLPPFPRTWHVPMAFHRRVEQLRPDVAHFNSLLFPLALRHLQSVMPSVPVVVQHHAERPKRGWRRLVQQVGLARAAGFFFVSHAQAEMYRETGTIRPDQPVFEVMEGSTPFRALPRASARAQTYLRGTPCCLWIGRLIPLKRPLVVLEAFARLVEQYPTAHLSMIFHEAPLLGEVEQKIAATPALKERVTLIGKVPHRDIQAYLSSADYFVLGSEYEGSGYALAEAMACGVVPLVTDIASFRMMTDNGRIGALWEVGSAISMVAAAQRLFSRSWAEESAQAFAHFVSHLSYEAIGRGADHAYRTVLAERNTVCASHSSSPAV